jgi:hypothetical protein
MGETTTDPPKAADTIHPLLAKLLPRLHKSTPFTHVEIGLVPPHLQGAASPLATVCAEVAERLAREDTPCRVLGNLLKRTTTVPARKFESWRSGEEVTADICLHAASLTTEMPTQGPSTLLLILDNVVGTGITMDGVAAALQRDGITRRYTHVVYLALARTALSDRLLPQRAPASARMLEAPLRGVPGARELAMKMEAEIDRFPAVNLFDPHRIILTHLIEQLPPAAISHILHTHPMDRNLAPFAQEISPGDTLSLYVRTRVTTNGAVKKALREHKEDKASLRAAEAAIVAAGKGRKDTARSHLTYAGQTRATPPAKRWDQEDQPNDRSTANCGPAQARFGRFDTSFALLNQSSVHNVARTLGTPVGDVLGVGEPLAEFASAANLNVASTGTDFGTTILRTHLIVAADAHQLQLDRGISFEDAREMVRCLPAAEVLAEDSGLMRRLAGRFPGEQAATATVWDVIRAETSESGT